MRQVLFQAAVQVLSRVAVKEIERLARRVMPARAIRSRISMSVAGAAMLIALQLGWAAAARAQANIMLSNAGVTGALATNTNWSIAKNGGFASGTWCKLDGRGDQRSP